MSRKIAVLIFGILMTILSLSKVEAAEKLYVNRYDTGSKIILSNGTAYIPLEAVAERLGTYVAWFPSVRVVVFNGVPISKFVRRNGMIYASAKEVANTCGATIKYNKHTRDLYFSAGNITYNTIANSNTKSATNTNGLATVYPSSSADKEDPTEIIRPTGAKGTIMEGLKLPRTATFSGVPNPESKLSTYITKVPAIQSKGNFSQKSAKNSVFSVTVTDMEEISVIKNRYNASAGNKYFVIYVSQQNISPEVQIYTGKFTLSDENSNIYDYMEGLSNYWLSILKPGGVNYGYLVFEVPKSSRASKLILNALNQPPLSIDLTH